MKRNVIALLCVILLLVSCNSEEKIQKQWIVDNLPTMVWQDLTYEALNSEYQRLSSSLLDMANNAQRSYNNVYYGSSWESEMLRAFDQLGTYMGDSSIKSYRNNILAKYRTNCESVIEDIRYNLGSCLTLRDSTFYGVDYERTDEELFQMLMGTPEKMPNLTDEDKKEIARGIAINTFQPMVLNKPAIALVEYNKDNKLWSVRMDNAENQYVKFYLREDKEYDVEYSSSINANGEPITENTITTSLNK